MDYNAVLAQVLALLQQEQRVAYRVLKRQFQLDDELLEDLKDDLIYAKKLAVDEDGASWSGPVRQGPRRWLPRSAGPHPSTYTPPIWRRKSSPPAPRWKASASRSPCCLPT